MSFRHGFKFFSAGINLRLWFKVPTQATRKKILSILQNREDLVQEGNAVDLNQPRAITSTPFAEEVKEYLGGRGKTIYQFDQVCLWLIHEGAQNWTRVEGISCSQFHAKYFDSGSAFLEGVDFLVKNQEIRELVD